MKKIFGVLACCLFLPIQSYSSSSGSDSEILNSYRFKSKTAHFNKQVQDAFKDPSTVSVDFSRANLNDEELNGIVFDSIQQRSFLTKSQKIDLISLGTGQEEGISRKGLLAFLDRLQKLGGTNPRIYDVLSGVILKTGLTLSQELVEAIQEVAPILIAAKLKIIE
jgi:hypothetical protein